MIPKVINYCWFGNNPLPFTARKCLNSWKEHCPGYEIKRWDESNFNVYQHPFVASAYNAEAWAFVSDWARLKIIYENGGIYLDTDVLLIKSLDSLLDNQCYIGVQQTGRFCTTGLGFGAVRQCSIVRDMLDCYNGVTFQSDLSKNLACPFLNDRVVRAHGYSGDGLGDIKYLDDVTVYPSRYFDPLAPGDTLNLMCDETISISLYANSWGGRKERFRRSLINLIGMDKIALFKEHFGATAK